jgi:hypothetical protein
MIMLSVRGNIAGQTLQSMDLVLLLQAPLFIKGWEESHDERWGSAGHNFCLQNTQQLDLSWPRALPLMLSQTRMFPHSC